MTQETNRKASGADVQSPTKPDVIVNQDALIIGGNFYRIDEIEDVEIKHFPWQFWAALACFIASAYLYAFHSDMRLWGFKAPGPIFLAMLGFTAWGNSEPAQMVLQLPDKRVQVLERNMKELKEIRARIKEAKKAKKAAGAPKA